jgi:DNA-binding transcriptional ArsR family regulator
MSIGQRAENAISIDMATGGAFTLLVALAAASGRPRSELPIELASALEEVGDTEGEAWLNLLGIPLDAGRPFTAERLLEKLRSLDAVELRRHLLGRFAWSWCSLAGIEDIEAAARGDARASGRLLEHPRYYGGHAAASLAVLLGLEPEETRDRIVRAVEAGLGSLLDRSALDHLDAAEQAAAATIASRPALVAIERLATGYRYVPEPEAESVVLIPHLEPELPLLLAQHRTSRLIVYCATPDRSSEERLHALGRALADPKRVEILALVGRGVGRAPDLVTETGLSRSTVHHHLALLRDSGLVALEGNARAYTYVPRHAAAAEAAQLVADLVGTEEEP